MQIEFTGNYTDLYQIAMGQAYFNDGIHEQHGVFDYFIRKIPFGGGYLVFAGLEDLIDALREWRFDNDGIEWLRQYGFTSDYLEYLRGIRFRGDIFSVAEGDVVFPVTPILRVEGSVIEAQLVETLVLNILNFQSLIATKAARIRSAAGATAILSEFGLRRAQGPAGVFAARAAVVGGFDSTSNVYAAERYGLKAEGTMAHSYIQWHGDELEAFRAFAAARPDNVVLLVDTYNTLESGIPNAIRVAHEMEARGEKMRGIRLDSGDLAFFAHRARAMLNEAGLDYVKIAASNQLDEYVIRSLREQGAPIDIYGVGTSLVTGHPDAAVDGVYKLAAAHGEPRLKLTENLAKTTLPGRKQLFRFFDTDGNFSGIDGITISHEEAPAHLIHPFEPHKSMSSEGLDCEPLLQPVMKNGEAINDRRNIQDIRAYAASRMALLPAEYRRFENPHAYKVGISADLHALRERLRKEH